MNTLTSVNVGLMVGAGIFLIPCLAILIFKKDHSLLPPPKPRDFGSFLAEWAQKKGFIYMPQQKMVVSGTYQNRWFAIRTRNAENALEIYMRVRNSQQHSLQIFGDWLEDSGVNAFINRFRIYSSPPGLGESLFAAGTSLRDVLSGFPRLRSRLELAYDSINKDEIRYSLLTDLSSSDDLDSIMNSMQLLCNTYESENSAHFIRK